MKETEMKNNVSTAKFCTNGCPNTKNGNKIKTINPNEA